MFGLQELLVKQKMWLLYSNFFPIELETNLNKI